MALLQSKLDTLPLGEHRGVGGWRREGGKFGIQTARPSFLRGQFLEPNVTPGSHVA